MATPSTGQLRPLSNGFEARISIDAGARKGFALTGVGRLEEKARERCTAMATIAKRLREAGHASRSVKILEVAAKARTDRAWQEILVAVDILCSGHATPLSAAASVTVAAFGLTWRSGDLHRKYPDRVPEIDHTRNDQLARLYVDPAIGPRPVASITLDDADEVMSKLPEMSPASRRHVAQYVSRLLRLAAYPGRLRQASPIPKGWLPSAKSKKAKECLLPDEDAMLLRAPSVPLLRRLAYGFLCREGLRTDELARLTWDAVSLDRGHLTLDMNKTDDPRDWQLDPGVVRALAVWKKRYCAGAKGTNHVFAVDGVPLTVDRLAALLRADLKRAGVTRPQLFESSAARRPIRAHDLRATFVTISLATGKTETWVADRTGHTTSQMINAYRRKARGWTMGPLTPLDEAIPELSSGHEQARTASTGAISGDLGSTKRLENRALRDSRSLVSALGSAVERHGGSSPLPCTESKKKTPIATTSSTSERAGQTHGLIMASSIVVDPVEAALASALTAAAAAGRFDVVAQLAKELEARRLAGTNVATLDIARRRR